MEIESGQQPWYTGDLVRFDANGELAGIHPGPLVESGAYARGEPACGAGTATYAWADRGGKNLK